MYLKDTGESLTRVGPRTPIGDLLRRFWLPAMHERDLPKADEGPIELRLLGENLIASRDELGDICIIDRYFKEMSPYRAVVNAGVVWVYMGPKSFAPQLPVFAWSSLPPIQRSTTHRIEACTWAYAIEKNIMAAPHPFFLPPFYTSPNDERGKAFVPIDDVQTRVWTFAPNGQLNTQEPPLPVDNNAVVDFRHHTIVAARELAKGHTPEAASHGDWYLVRPFPD